MKKSIMNAKATAIATIEAAENIRKNMSYAEEMLVNSIIFQGVEDKDQEMEEEQTEMVYIPKKGWVKQSKKQYSKKNQLKDKSKAGYHNGAAKEGCGDWDKFGLDIKLNTEVKRDLKSQLNDLNNPVTEMDSISDMVAVLLTYLNTDIYTNGIHKVYYHYSSEFANFSRWADIIDSYKAEVEQYIHSIIIDLYELVDENWPEVGFADRNEAVMEVKEALEDELASTLKSMMDYCVRCWKEENFPEF